MNTLDRLPVPVVAPVLVRAVDGLPLGDPERSLVAYFDGLHTIDEIARETGSTTLQVRALVSDLVWFGAVALEEVMQVAEDELLADEQAPWLAPRRQSAAPLPGCASPTEASIEAALRRLLDDYDA